MTKAQKDAVDAVKRVIKVSDELALKIAQEAFSEVWEAKRKDSRKKE